MSCATCADCTRSIRVRLLERATQITSRRRCPLLTRRLRAPVGDTYVACGGLFDSPSSSHPSANVVDHALLFSLLAHEAAAGLGLRLRAGVHCGAATSGLVGSVRGAPRGATRRLALAPIALRSHERFSAARLCLFGDAVDTAGLMETSCDVGAVRVSAAAWARTRLPDELTQAAVVGRDAAPGASAVLLRAQGRACAEAKRILLARGWPQPRARKNEPAALSPPALAD